MIERIAAVSAAGCFVFVGNDLLVLFRRKDGTWGIPGGKIEEAETPLEAARREMLEEVGIVCSGDDDDISRSVLSCRISILCVRASSQSVSGYCC